MEELMAAEPAPPADRDEGEPSDVD
jgi:hypothetical protein